MCPTGLKNADEWQGRGYAAICGEAGTIVGWPGELPQEGQSVCDSSEQCSCVCPLLTGRDTEAELPGDPHRRKIFAGSLLGGGKKK